MNILRLWCITFPFFFTFDGVEAILETDSGSEAGLIYNLARKCYWYGAISCRKKYTAPKNSAKNQNTSSCIVSYKRSCHHFCGFVNIATKNYSIVASRNMKNVLRPTMTHL